MNTQRVLKKLFDFQSFEKNPRLERLIRETEGDVAALSDDELSLVNAAGDIDTVRISQNPKDF